MGSAAMGADVPGVSDLDVWALVAGSVAPGVKEALVGRVDHAALPCPARGLELVVARFGVGGADRRAEPRRRAADGAPRRARRGRRAAPLVRPRRRHRTRARAGAGGPAAGRGLPPVPRSLQLVAIAESLDWYAEHEPDNRKAVLTAARGLRYVLEGRWTSKEDAARWAAARRPDWASEIAEALAERRGG